MYDTGTIARTINFVVAGDVGQFEKKDGKSNLYMKARKVETR